MTAVADTSPVCYLNLIGEIGVLPQLFGKILIPQAALKELRHHEAPELVQVWAHRLPSRVSVFETAVTNASGLEKLQAGERAAILLAEFKEAEIILLDEKAARRVASDRGLRVTGILGLLGEASTRGLVDLPAALDRLRKTNFRCSAALL